MSVWSQRLVMCVFMLVAHSALAGEFFEERGDALRGYDPVSYVDDGEATKGLAQYAHIYKGSKFLFVSSDHKREFAENPEKYAPQFGGFCAYGTSQGYKVSTQPDAFKVVDGKLYLNYNRQVQDIWSKDIPANIARAQEKWPEVQKMDLKQ